MSDVSFPAMGTTIEAWFVSDEDALRDWFEHVEAACSRFRPESELSLLNADESHRPSPLLADVLGAAQRARDLTGGLVDAGVGRAVADWGYDRTFTEVTALRSPPPERRASEWRLEGARLVRSAGTVFDLGGIAKGWTCDRAVECGLARVVSAGGDLRSGHPDTVVSIIDTAGTVAARIRVGMGALATSSTARRRWKVGDREVSHLVDPRTMKPVVSPVVTASVVAPTAAAAEAGAKAVLLLGADGLAWADEQPWIDAAVVVWHDGSVFATGGLEAA